MTVVDAQSQQVTADIDRAATPWAETLTGSDTFHRMTRRIVKVTVQGNEPRWLPTVLDRMTSLSRLDSDWDGCGSLPPAKEAILTALEVMKELLPADAAIPSIGPTPSQGVQFEWHAGGWDVEIEVMPDHEIELWGERVDGGRAFDGGWLDAREDARLAIKDLTASALG